MNKLFFGDCLDVLRNEIPDESVDLVYLDPPFNSNRSYNLLFSAPSGHQSEAQIAAFEDTWHWGEQAEREYREILGSRSTATSELVVSLRRFLGENDMMAYLTLMANRLIELRRTMRHTASLYLHCDPTASHYLKVLLDSIFGFDVYQNEIVWKRSHSHNSAKRYGPIHDIVLFYSKTGSYTWTDQRTPYEEEYVAKFFKYDDNDGRGVYWTGDITGNGIRHGETGLPWRGFNPTAKGRHWMYQPSDLDALDQDNRVYWPKTAGAWPKLKRYITEAKGIPLQDLIDDIYGLSTMGGPKAERLGYPTQKPLALLERLISASSIENQVVLDPFCGCGTAIHAAERLKRQWIGIDITHLAISLIEKRLRDAFPGIEFEVHGTPKDLEGARNLASRDKYQFQWWACSLVGAQPWQDKKKGADRGIDGIIYFQDEKGIPKKIIVSVKGGETVGRAMIADLKNSVEREKAQIGLFVTLAIPTREMAKEALTAGFYESPMFRSSEYPKIQILTIEGLLNGTQRPRYPDLSQGTYTFKRATQESDAAEQAGDLFM